MYTQYKTLRTYLSIRKCLSAILKLYVDKILYRLVKYCVIGLKCLYYNIFTFYLLIQFKEDFIIIWVT